MNAALIRRLWLVGPLLLVLAPHAVRLPVWLDLAWLACAGLSLAGAARERPVAGGMLKVVVALAGLAGVLLEYGSVIGPTAGIALLAFLSGAKLLEGDQPRDRLGLLFVGIFLLVAQFLDDQSLLTAAYMGLAATALVAGLIASQTPGPELARQPFQALRPAAGLLVQALPLALLLFLLFPRMQGPLWGLPHAGSATSGLSDRMAPGEISRLIQSDELAFRAEFPDATDAARIDARVLYWRGPVLWDYDGRVWQSELPPLGAPRLEDLGDSLRYVITLEPHHQRWLFLLGAPGKMPDLPSRLGPDLQWMARSPVDQRLRYEVGGYLAFRLDARLPPDLRQRALALPETGNPRTLDLARRWRGEGMTDEAMVRRALARFREETFVYTLTPPALGGDAVDKFLFSTRRGFCEHYAGAFVFLMRAAGIPARVVTGYQGGEYSALGRYWIIRGRDAHAWAEVWLPERGWVRVDPTAAVAPDRVERGIRAALPAAELPGRLVNLEGAWLQPLRLGWDLINNQWNQWVLGYDQQRQRRFLSSLSPLLSTLEGSLLTLLASASLILGLLALRLFRRRRTPRDPAARAYGRFCRRLSAVGLRRLPAEAPEAFARRAAASRADLAAAIHDVTRRYLAVRYGRAGSGDLAGLVAAVGAFRPRRQPG